LKGEERTLRLRVFGVKGLEVEGEKYLFIIIDNLTKKKNFDALRRKYEFEISLISSFSHELKTPLNVTI
jgi:signal transduction histidine kinase